MIDLIGMPDGVTLTMLPKLPTAEFKCDGVTYTATDLKYLNAAAVWVIDTIFKKIRECPGMDEITIRIPADQEGLPGPYATWEDVTDIVMAASYTARKGGKNGFFSAGALIGGRVGQYITESGSRVFTFHTDGLSDAIMQACESGNDTYVGIVIARANVFGPKYQRKHGGAI